MKKQCKTTRLISLSATAALSLGAALPFGAAHAGDKAVCYKPVADDWKYGIEYLMRDGALDNLTGGRSLSLGDSMMKNMEVPPNGDGMNGYGPPVRLVYSAKKTGKLTRRNNKFGHGEQSVYDANGKVTNVAGPYTMQGFTGSAISTKGAKYPSPNGARLSGEISAIQIEADATAPGLSLPLEIDCTTHTSSVTPNYWQCNFTAVILGFPVKLEKVNIDRDPYCSIFQDGAVRDDSVPEVVEVQ